MSAVNANLEAMSANSNLEKIVNRK